jgi:hypothetical protein
MRNFVLLVLCCFAFNYVGFSQKLSLDFSFGKNWTFGLLYRIGNKVEFYQTRELFGEQQGEVEYYRYLSKYGFNHRPLEFSYLDENGGFQFRLNAEWESLSLRWDGYSGSYGRKLNNLIESDTLFLRWVQLWGGANIFPFPNRNFPSNRSPIRVTASDRFRYYGSSLLLEPKLSSKFSVPVGLSGFVTDYGFDLFMGQKADIMMEDGGARYEFVNDVKIKSSLESGIWVFGGVVGLKYEPWSWLQLSTTTGLGFSFQQFKYRFVDIDDAKEFWKYVKTTEVYYLFFGEGTYFEERKSWQWSKEFSILLIDSDEWLMKTKGIFVPYVLLRLYNVQEFPVAVTFVRPWDWQNPASAPSGSNYELIQQDLIQFNVTVGFRLFIN